MNLNPRTSLVESEVVKILYLKRIANETPDGFNDVPWITRAPINKAQNESTQITILPKNIPQVQILAIKRTDGRDKQLQKKKAIICSDSGIVSMEVRTKPTRPIINDNISMYIIPSLHAIKNLKIRRNKSS